MFMRLTRREVQLQETKELEEKDRRKIERNTVRCQEELQLIGSSSAIAGTSGVSPVCNEDCNPYAGRIAGSTIFGDKWLLGFSMGMPRVGF